MIYEPVERNVLVVVKTYPTPSSKYVETVCTAGITDKGEWIRLYPVKFRYLNGEKQYQLFSWIKVKTIKSRTDIRPESHKIYNEHIEVISTEDSVKGSNERKRFLLPLVKQSMEEIEEEYRNQFKTLAIFKPRKIIGFCADPENPDWTEAEEAKLAQISLFDTPESVPQKLKKVPYSFRCEYFCNNPTCRGHKQKIIIWDFNWAYFQYLEKYKSEKEALKKLEERWMSYFSSERDGYLMVGTLYPRKSFLIIGVLSLKKGDTGYMQPLI